MGSTGALRLNQPRKLSKRVIFDRDEAGSKSRHVGFAPKAESKIRALACVTTGLCGLMASPGA